MKLLILDGPMRGAEFFLRSARVGFGRDRMNEVRLADEAVVLFHCQVVPQDGENWLEDLGSAGGTPINGAPSVARAQLHEGDVFAVGEIHVAALADLADSPALLDAWAAGRFPPPGSAESRGVPGATGAPERPRAKVLLIDDDPDMLVLLETVMRSKGHLVTSASDGEQGLAAAERDVPDVIVTDVMMPRLDGWSVVRRLRASSRFALVPVIFLTALSESANRMRGFQLGADDYLAKSEVMDLPMRVESALNRRERLAKLLQQHDASSTVSAASAPASEPGLRGTLDQLGLPTLMTSLEQEKKTGVLTLSRGDRPAEARIYLREGNVVAAQVDGDEPARNAEAIYAMLEWPAGSFAFSTAAVDRPDEVKASTVQLLMEGMRLQDERGRDPRG